MVNTISLNYRDARPIYQQLKEGLIKLVVTGAIKENEKLPSMRELAATLAINPNTIARAYRELESEGYIHTVPGKGCFAASRDGAGDRRRNALLLQFDEISRELIFLGVTADELKQRLVPEVRT